MAIVTTVVTVVFILFLIPVLLVALVLGLIDELRQKKYPVPKGVSKPLDKPNNINGRSLDLAVSKGMGQRVKEVPD